ncbi:aldehyde dehydrogenase family protein [Candidatus Woesearchaeota archaeon]|nr:aldehyde dehydrogenase family protein [Candidatus Woesearchaeota archaeon]MBW3022179.1 aldehyde dehydrogenase family protein [Candidatus Woesearchaeota archaeon]
MLENKILNFVAGREKKSYSGEFQVESQFYDYRLILPNSSVVDLAAIVSPARTAGCERLAIEDRMRILKRAAAALEFSNEEVEHLVKMTGMPVANVKQRLGFSRKLLDCVPDCIEERIGNLHGLAARKINGSGLEMYLSPEGLICAFVPPNDPAESAFILAHTVMAGGSIIIKPSSLEPYLSVKFAKLLTECGYPKHGINVVHWNTSDEKRASMGHELVKRCYNRIVMGDRQTAEKLLEVYDENGNLIRGNDCIYCAGNSKWILDKGLDYEDMAAKIAHAVLDWPTDCITPRTVFVVGDETKLLEHLVTEFEKRRCGDPLDSKTQIGYVDHQTIQDAMRNIKTGKELNSIDVVLNGRIVRRNQMTPSIYVVHEHDSQFLRNETPYMLSIVKVPDFETAVNFLNNVYDDGTKIMAVSVFSGTDYKGFEHKEALHRIKAHMKFYNKSSMELDPVLSHQDVYLFEQLATKSPLLLGGHK